MKVYKSVTPVAKQLKLFIAQQMHKLKGWYGFKWHWICTDMTRGTWTSAVLQLKLVFFYVEFSLNQVSGKTVGINPHPVREAFNFHASEQQDISECFSVFNILID